MVQKMLHTFSFEVSLDVTNIARIVRNVDSKQ